MAGFAGFDASHAVADMLVQKTADFPQFQFVDMVVDIPVGTQRPFFHGPNYSADHGDSPVALVQGGAQVDVEMSSSWTLLLTCPVLVAPRLMS